jgi:hypothetical protein
MTEEIDHVLVCDLCGKRFGDFQGGATFQEFGINRKLKFTLCFKCADFAYNEFFLFVQREMKKPVRDEGQQKLQAEGIEL